MRADKRIGVILVLVGVGLPLLLLPFTGSYFHLGFWSRVTGGDIQLWQTEPEKPCPHSPAQDQKILGPYADPCFPIPAEYFAIPYRYFFALGVVLFLGGLGHLILGNMRNKGG